MLELIADKENLWCSNGFAAAPMFDFKELNKDQAFALFNLDEKERKKTTFVTSKAAEGKFDDICKTEELLEPALCEIKWQGYDLTVLPSTKGLILLRTAHYNLFLKEDSQSRFFVRWDQTEDGSVPTVAVKSGLMLKGLLAPVTWVFKDEKFIGMLEEIFGQAKKAKSEQLCADLIEGV